ncbi:MAG TPA: M1 family metallopeptidase [Methanocorpusculum sp.]|nr:M1 family metallopeptidase [Methanocorpusculum sp.]HJJ54347.1 M1 family metallopeptidase [Methanocorpusculum sp.]
MADTYRYHPAEFPEPPVRVNHITVVFDITEERVTVSAETTFTVRTDKLSELVLNAKNLEIQSIRQNTRPVSYVYENDLITISLQRPLSKGAEFKISTISICRPTSNILEGIYYDITPKGLPRTMITQCQQWGFQRMVPCLDDMRAKSTWTTTIIADSRYTNLISNGNVVRERMRYDDMRDTITYQNNEPMPPYLFFLGVGTWDTFARNFTYPDGKKVRLELLGSKGSDPSSAKIALNILADGILWVYLYTGPEKYDDIDLRNEVYRLSKVRDDLTLDTSPEECLAAIEPVQRQISFLMRNLVCGYQYPFEVYREISMQNSDFGGMENTGNTTIIASRIMPDPELSDASYEYLIGVKLHEFYHNLNGSSVTGDTPFSIWLNEAATVMIEDEYLAFLFGKEYVRLQNILQIYTPGTGTFSLDTGLVAMPIEPSGFNDPNDLITSVTYVKAPEFTRMIEIMIGKRPFAWALDLYHRRFAGKNASPRDWLHAMEDVGKTDFSFMSDRWLKQTGYPVVSASAKYIPENDVAEIFVTQKVPAENSPWIFPLTGRLINDKGVIVADFIKKIDSTQLTFQIPCTGAFSFAVWNLNHAAYLRMETSASDDELYLQLEHDTDVVTSFLAHCTLFEREMVRLCRDDTAEVSKRLVDEYFGVLSDSLTMERVGALALTLFESVHDPAYAYSYTKLHAAKKRFMSAVARSHTAKLHALLMAYTSTPEKTSSPAKLARTFKTRSVKNLILSLLATLDTPEVHTLLQERYEKAVSSSGRMTALSLYLSSSAKGRMEMLYTELARSKGNSIAFENFISAVSGTSSPDTVEYLKIIESSPSFDPEQAGMSRALYLRFSENRKVSIETKAGREFLEGSLLRLALVNEYLTTGMLSVFSHLNEYADDVRGPLVRILENLRDTIPECDAPSVHRSVIQILDKVGKRE